MGTWSSKPFGNDAALDWLGELEEAGSVEAIEALIRKPFEEAAAFMRDAVDGVIMRTISPDELEAMIVYSTSEITSARERRSIEKMLRETFTGEPYRDDGGGAPQVCFAAGVYVCWRLGRDAGEKEFKSLKNAVAGSYQPSHAIVADVGRGLAAVAGHPAYARNKKWQAAIASLRAGFSPV